MNKIFTIFVLTFLSLCAIRVAQAEPLASQRVANRVESVVTGGQLTATNAFGTPLVMELARKGDIETLRTLAEVTPDKSFLDAHDKYNNNLFHVAKDARTVQFISALIRQADGAKAYQRLSKMANQRNTLDETPLLAQINAGHTDTFHLLYRSSTLRQKNDEFKNHLARIQGSDPRMVQRHKEIYCKQIRQLSSANGLTLLQAARAQIPYNSQMAPLAQQIAQTIPCLAQD